MKHRIEWLDRGHPPRQRPNPAYPNGCYLDLTEEAKRDDKVKLTEPPPPSANSCMVELPYPTGHANVGTWMVSCPECGLTTMITAASRPDDPRSVKLPCKRTVQ